MKNLYFFVAVYFLLISCGTLDDAGKAMRNEKVKTTDEFLVKKRNPLVLPPDYEKIPEPGSLSTNKNQEEEKIKNILKAPKTEDSSNNKTSTIEKSIIDRIRK